MMSLWMVLRYLKDGRRYLSLNILLSVLGVALAVSALVVAMAVVSGYETTLRETVIDIHGHLMVLERGGLISNREESEVKIQEIVPELKALTPFALVEGVVVHKGKMSGILMEGIHPETAPMVINMGRVLARGKYDLTWDESFQDPPALIGKGLFEKLNLEINETLRIVTPLRGRGSADQFRSKVQKFRVVGVLDLGRHDYDERYIITSIEAVQAFAELGDKISGWRVRLNSYLEAESVSTRVARDLGPPFESRYWRDSNRNLFDAVSHEKPVIFIIVSLMLVAAAFNVSSTLFVSVVRRYREISILKAMGASQNFIRRIFAIQGMIIGFVGAFAGIVLGSFFCQVFMWAEKKWNLFPGDVYKLTFVQVEMRAMDVLVIILLSSVMCFLATFAPARRGAGLTPVEGLRYE